MNILNFNLSNLILLATEVTDIYDINDGDRTTVGGGEVIDFLNPQEKFNWVWHDTELMNHFENLGWYKVALTAALILILILIMLKIFNIRTVGTDPGVRAEIDNIKNLRRNDKAIKDRAHLLKWIVNFVSMFGIRPDENYIDYMNYNLKRAGIMAPEGERTLTAIEYYSLVKFGTFVTTIICLLSVFIFKSSSVGVILIAVELLCWQVFPNVVVRSMALQKDAIIRENFFDFYAELHYILKDGGNAPLNKRIRAYAKSVMRIPEMVRFADNCADLIDLYGEYDATLYIAKEYREISEVGKLMRLIRQFNENADITNDLEGFRQQLLTEKELKMADRQKKLIQRARMSFNVLIIILVQAIFSAMAIYFKDIMSVGSFLK